MFFDAHRLADYLDLLDQAGRFFARRQHAAAIGAGLERVFVRGVDLLRRKGRALVFGVARLAALGAFVTTVRLGGLAWFHNIAARPLGRGARVLTQSCHFRFHLGDTLLKAIDDNEQFALGGAVTTTFAQ